jgi:hypothetical protein
MLRENSAFLISPAEKPPLYSIQKNISKETTYLK